MNNWGFPDYCLMGMAVGMAGLIIVLTLMVIERMHGL